MTDPVNDRRNNVSERRAKEWREQVQLCTSVLMGQIDSKFSSEMLGITSMIAEHGKKLDEGLAAVKRMEESNNTHATAHFGTCLFCCVTCAALTAIAVSWIIR